MSKLEEKSKLSKRIKRYASVGGVMGDWLQK